MQGASAAPSATARSARVRRRTRLLRGDVDERADVVVEALDPVQVVVDQLDGRHVARERIAAACSSIVRSWRSLIGDTLTAGSWGHEPKKAGRTTPSSLKARRQPITHPWVRARDADPRVSERYGWNNGTIAGTAGSPAAASSGRPKARSIGAQQRVVVVRGAVGDRVAGRLVGDHDGHDVATSGVGAAAAGPRWPWSEKSSSSQVTTMALRPCCQDFDAVIAATVLPT